MNDRVIELEVAVQQKDLRIDKHVKRIRLLNEKNSDDKKARNLVSSIFDYLMKQYFKFMLSIMLFSLMITGFVFRVAGT